MKMNFICKFKFYRDHSALEDVVISIEIQNNRQFFCQKRCI